MYSLSEVNKIKDIADANLENAQLQQQHWYNKNARVREFKPGDMVLLLLPTSTSKLMGSLSSNQEDWKSELSD